MTDLQVKYQTLLEQRRSNVARETETHRSNVAQEAKIPYEIEKLIADSGLSAAKAKEAEASYRKMMEEIELIKRRTDLTDKQARLYVADLVLGWIDNALKDSNIMMDSLSKAFGIVSKAASM